MPAAPARSPTARSTAATPRPAASSWPRPPRRWPRRGTSTSRRTWDLLELSGGFYSGLKGGEGLQTGYEYYGDGENAPGRLKETAVRHGNGGQPAKQETITYVKSPFADAPVYLPETRTVYEEEQGGRPVVTTTAYKWHGSTAQPSEARVRLPEAAGEESTTATFDEFGRTRIMTDAGGTSHATDFDDKTGAVTRQVDDVGGLNLVTEALYWDALGRVWRTKDPRGKISTTHYFDEAVKRSVVHTSPEDVVTSVETDYAAGTVSTKASTPNSREPQLIAQQTLDHAGRTVSSKRFPGDGEVYTTRYAFDAAGRPSQTTSAAGTTYATSYDGLGRPARELVNGSLVTSYEYDDGAGGDGLLTKATQHPSGTAGGTAANPDRVTRHWYDWRGRATISGDGVAVVASSLDNLGRPKTTTTYDARLIGEPQNGGGTPTIPAGSDAARRARVENIYDKRSRLTRVTQVGVNQSNGGLTGRSEATNFAYDARDNLVRVAAPGGLVTTHAYDSLGRDTLTASGSDAVKVQEVETRYDAAGNVVLTTQTQRRSDGLGGQVVTNVAHWYDGDGRVTADAVSTGGLDPAAPAPFRSDTTLVTSYGYDVGGFLKLITDPRGIATRQVNDQLGRTVQKIDNATADGAEQPGSRSTRYSYDGLDHLLLVGVYNTLPDGTTHFESTNYQYGPAGAEGGSVLLTNDQLGHITYSGNFIEKYAYNALGEVTKKRDRNGTLHEYEHDLGGRVTGDVVTDYGTADDDLDQYVDKLAFGYDALGRVTSARSEGGTGSGWAVLNEVKREYNDFGQLSTESQAHSGAVNGTTPRVSYDYLMVNGASQLDRMSYPSGGQNATYAYDAIGRPSQVSFNGAAAESYAYLGLGTVVAKDRSGTQPDMAMTLDGFGRPNSITWGNPASPVDGYAYGYDRAGNKLYAANLNNPGLSELWHAPTAGVNTEYSPLGYSLGFRRGTLSNGGRSVTAEIVASRQNYSRDTQGNLAASQSNATSGGNTTDFDTNSNGWEISAKYDAWNRLRYTNVGTGNATVDHYYDALGRLIWTDENAVVRLNPLHDERHHYYDAAGHVIEEQQGGTGVTDVRYIISPADGSIVLRDRDADGNAGNGLEQRVWLLSDAFGNATALADAAGAVVERYVYDGLGSVQALDAGWGERTLTYAAGWGDGRNGDQMLGEYYGAKPRAGMLSGTPALTPGEPTSLAGTAYAWRHYAGGAFYDRVPGVYLSGGDGAFNPRQGRALTPDLGAMGLGLPAYNGGTLSLWDQAAIYGSVPIAAVAGTLAGGPVGGYLAAVGVLGFVSGYNRAADGQSVSQVIGGGAADATGFSQIYGGILNKDIATAQGLGWTGGERVLHGSLGALQFLPVAQAGAGAINRAGSWLAAEHAANMAWLRGLGGAGKLAYASSGSGSAASAEAVASAAAWAGPFVSGSGATAGVSGLLGNAAYKVVTGTTRGGVNRVSPGWRSMYGPAQLRDHHLVPQQLLKDSRFTSRLKSLGLDPRRFVDQRIARITNSLHEDLHVAGWNRQWNLFLDANPHFTVRDVEHQISVLSNLYNIPRSSRNFISLYGK